MERDPPESLRLEGHPTPVLPWVDVATGSLGQGLPVGSASPWLRDSSRCPRASGSSAGTARWPRARSGSGRAHGPAQPRNLVAIIDVNRLGQTGETMHGWDLNSYGARAEASGWEAVEIDGHDVQEIDDAMARATEPGERPTMIVARTKKGKGVKAVEDQPGKHA